MVALFDDGRHRWRMDAYLSSPLRRAHGRAVDSIGRSCGGTFASVRFAARRVGLALAARSANRRFALAVAGVALLSAKSVHLYAHANAIPLADILRYGPSFVAQDAAVLIFLRLLLDSQLFAGVRWLGILLTTLATLVALVVLFLAAVSISFFVVAGSELHWRNIGVAGSSSNWTMLLTGLFSCSVTAAGILLLAWTLQDVCYHVASIALDILKSPFSLVLRRLPFHGGAKYEHVPQHEVDAEAEAEAEPKPADDDTADQPSPLTGRCIPLYVVVGLGMLVQLVTTLGRPDESSLRFMSWTLPLLPFVDFARSSPMLANLLPLHGTGIDRSWDVRTALADPIPLTWLPWEKPTPGFLDWHENKKHYRASEDPLKISNLDDGLLPALEGKLADVKIRHVMLIKLESTRKDVFPFKKGGIIWDKLSGSFKNHSLPDRAARRLATLTPNANFLTGDYDDGFEHGETKRRGGINFGNAHTTSTYTLKSLAGTLCGVTPLVADFNVEQAHHVYQPCLPHIFDALNNVRLGGDGGSGAHEANFTSFKWRSRFVQSVTDTYDKQDAEMPVLGYLKENVVTKEYLKSDAAKFGKVDAADINYYGMPEVVVEDYIRDAFASAKNNSERVFLTHLTSTTHHPFGMPEDEEYVPLADDNKYNDLSRYVNAVGYVDRWLGRILKLLEDEGVADETLLVLVGDHGLSVPENDGITPYYNANVGNFHVPLVVSHPKLPPMKIDDAVNSIEILPTILDMLVETGSLAPAERAAARDLVRNYEGQSLIRPLRKSSEATGQGAWQFTVMNPGRATLSVRDARRPGWRIIVPIVENNEWRFTDLAADPHEEHAILSFGFFAFLRAVEEKHGIEASKWAEEAAFVTRWWVDENARRWRYNQRN
ncbi:sulfatase domain protein [Drechmeria coniospora]|uniref:Sulfatase domain protein n=1 Tax=Drechmeria coniospora TaxID=98403 RepID=A0A151GJ02_DRECN|nr:sulfatase domain protein [Drechmeria coniospora]KYK57077.1 sulfatase domain protein [Drechmeria coniospora]